MKFCYVDESGYGDEPILVFAGVTVDHTRMHLIKDTWSDTLKILERRTGQNIREFHAAKFHGGKGLWKNIPGGDRAEIVSDLLALIAERKHSVVVTSVVKERFRPDADERHASLGTTWCAGAFHMLLALQRLHQKQKKNKGHTVFVFDHEVIEQAGITDLVRNPPGWSDGYYDRSKRQDRLDQIIDVPHFANSEHVLLVQLADLIAYLVRRYAELVEGHRDPDYDDEPERLEGWMAQLQGVLIPSAHCYKKNNLSEAQALFVDLASPPIVELARA